MGAFEFINGDFNADGFYTDADIDALVAEIAATTHDGEKQKVPPNSADGF